MHNDLIASFRLGLNKQGHVFEVDGKAFDVRAYSRMKYGVRSELKRFAAELAETLHSKAPGLFDNPRPPAFLTSYKAAAPPSTTLARYCLDLINLHRFKRHLNPGEMVQVYRTQDYIEEYAILSPEDRKRLIGSQRENTLRGRDLKDYKPVIIDDICVTGTYTAMMRNTIGGHEEVMAAYLAVCDGAFKLSSHAEGMLNSSEIKKPFDLLPFIRQDDFIFTRRFLKMLLRTSIDELKLVIAHLPDPLLEQVVRGVIDTDSQLQFIFPDACRLMLESAEDRRIFGSTK